MLRYFRQGHRDSPSTRVPSVHYNWVFFAALDGPVQVMKRHGEVPPQETRRLWLFAPERLHCFACGPETERIVLAFTSVSPVVEKLCKETGYLWCDLTDGDIAYWRVFGREINEHFLAPNPKSLLVFEKALNELCLLLLRDREFEPFSPLSMEATERVERAIRYFFDHLDERPKLTTIASAADVSVSHLRRLFHQVFGQSPATMLTRLSLERATQLLLTTADTMEVIASSCGFQSASDFTRVFQKYYGCPPNIWRQYVSPLAEKRGKNERAEFDPLIVLRNLFPENRARPDFPAAGQEAPPPPKDGNRRNEGKRG